MVFKTKYKYNKDVFKELNNKSAYWIGFLSGDGYINGNRIQLGVSHKDIELLRQYKDFIQSPKRPIRVFMNNTNSQCCEVRIRSYEFLNDLKKYNLQINKKNRQRLHIDLLQKEIRRHFLRGYFDADGCFTIDQRGYMFAEITGYKPLLKDIKNILVSEGIVNESKKIVKNGKIFRIRLCATDTIKLGEYLYEGYPNIYALRRKYNIYTNHAERLNKLGHKKLYVMRQSKKKDIRPIDQWNPGKQAEEKDRVLFNNKEFKGDQNVQAD